MSGQTPRSPGRQTSAASRRGSPARPAASKKQAARRPAQKKTSKKSTGRTQQRVRTLPAATGIKVKSRAPARPPNSTNNKQPAWWRRLQKQLPPYADELFGFLLIGLGLLSFLTLLSPESGEIGSAWSGLLRQWFGLGAFVISAVIVGAGATLLVPKLGIPVRVNLWRFIVGEVFFFLLLAYGHAAIRARIGGEAGRLEAFARAFEGRGGGLVGWAIQEAVHALFGDVITGLLLLAGLITCAVLLLGIEREQILRGLNGLQERLVALSERMQPPPLPEPPPPAPANIIDVPPPPRGRPSILTAANGEGLARGSATNSDGKPMTRLERLRARLPLNARVEPRFKLEEIDDGKKPRKRSDKLPPLDLLEAKRFGRPDEEEINLSATVIEEAIADFGLQAEVVAVKAGPSVTQYAVSPVTKVEVNGEMVEQRVRVTRIASLGKDLALALAAPSVRIQAPVPGTRYIGIEVPNAEPGIVSLRPVMESEEFYRVKGPLAIALGREVDGRPYVADLAKMPHLLIGGTTGSGKSVCLRSIATCLVANNRPDQLKLVMIDPKMVELIRFNGLPHLLGRVEVQLDRVLGVLRWVTREMERRYKLMEEDLSRNIDIYNRKNHWSKRLPHMVVLIDELAELMTQYPDETEHLITRLAQMARATGIHLVVATQRPSTDVVTGLIKANFPARIAFQVASGVDSRVVLDSVGAEDLIGNGDMLYQSPEAAAPVRLQGCFVSDYDMEKLVDYWRDTWEDDDDRIAPWERALSRRTLLEETDELLEEAIRVVQQEREASASQLQRKLNVGYPRAGRIIDSLYRLGVVGPEQAGGRTREVLIQPGDDPIDYILKKQGKL